MRQSNEDRRRSIQSLSRKLWDIAITRLQLVQQLENLDTRAEQLHSERSMLQTLETTITHLPDEMLTMIFEEGTTLKPSPVTTGRRPKSNYSSQHFGVLVSHVTRRWRNIALETPRLWTHVQCIAQDYLEEDPQLYPKMMPVFLSRAKALPLDITIAGSYVDSSVNLYHLMSGQVEHCGRLCVKDLDPAAQMVMIHCVASQPAPLLSSIHLGSLRDPLIFNNHLFQGCAPRLTTVQLDYVDFHSMHRFCLQAFNSITSLRLTHIFIYHGRYNPLRESLMSLKSLHHLELSLVSFHSQEPMTVLSSIYLPIVLPTIKLLRLHSNVHRDSPPETFSRLVCSIEAPSLIALSLGEPLIPAVLENRFPSMRHLLVANTKDVEEDFVVLAQSFPDIERLTFQGGRDMDDIFKAILSGDGDDNEDGGRVVVQWPKLQTIAVSAHIEHFNGFNLPDLILKSQRAGRPIRKILLPRTVISGEDADAMVELGKVVEIDKFHDDWPTPFDWSKD